VWRCPMAPPTRFSSPHRYVTPQARRVSHAREKSHSRRLFRNRPSCSASLIFAGLILESRGFPRLFRLPDAILADGVQRR